MNFLSYDSPIIQFLSKVMKLIVLNLLIIIFCLPFFTVGATITAGHYAALKIRRNEGYVISDFWKSFRENFKQSTMIWLGLVLNVLFAIAAYRVASSMGGAVATAIILFIFLMLIITLFIYIWIFPIQAKFENTILETIKNAYVLAFKHLLRTLYMIMVSAIPLMLMEIMTLQWYIPLFILFGISLTIYCNVMMYDNVFENLECMIHNQENKTEREER